MTAAPLHGPTWLFWSWLTHDMEEVVTMADSTRVLRERKGLPLPALSQRDVAIAITFMGMAAAAGQRSKGQSKLYRIAAAGYIAHAFTHLGSALLARQYTSGVATVFPVILPAGRIIRKEQRELGHPLTPKDCALGISLLPPLSLTAHTLAKALSHRLD